MCSGTVIAAMTAYFDIPLTVANLLTGLTSTFCCLQIFGAAMYSRTRSRYGFLIGTNIVWRVLIALIFASVLIPGKLGAAVFTVLTAAMVAVYQLSNPSYNDWMSNTVEGRATPDYFSVREMTFMLSYTCLFCAANLIIDRSQKANSPMAGFLILGVMELAVLAISAAALLRLPRAAVSSAQGGAPIMQSMRKVVSNKKFMRILVANAVWTFSTMFVGNYASVYQVRTLGVTFEMIMIYATAANLVRTALSLFIGRMARRLTWRNTMLSSVAMMALSAALWMLITPSNMAWLFPILSVLGALPYAGFGIGILTLEIDATRSEDRTPYFSLIATVNGMVALLGSALCSAAIGALETAVPDGLRFIFGIGLAGFIAAAVCVARLSEPCE